MGRQAIAGGGFVAGFGREILRIAHAVLEGLRRTAVLPGVQRADRIAGGVRVKHPVHLPGKAYRDHAGLHQFIQQLPDYL